MRCRPGDLAIITRSETASEIGLPVKVMEISLLWTAHRHAPVWRIEIDHARMVRTLHGDAFYLHVPGDGGQLFEFDANLRPIRGDETPEEIAQLLELENV